MKPQKHRKRILKILAELSDEVIVCFEEGHLKWPPKTLKEVELDIDALLHELLRTEFTKRTK